MMPMATATFGRAGSLGGGGSGGYPLTRAKLTTDYTTVTSGVEVPLEDEDTDDLNWFAATSADIVVDAAALYRATLIWDMTTTNSNTIPRHGISVNGTLAIAAGQAVGVNGSGFRGYGGTSTAPLSLAASDNLSVITRTVNSSTIHASTVCHLQVEKLPTGLNYAIIGKSANQTITVAGTYTDVSLNTLVAGSSSWVSGDNLHLVVPSGVTRVRVTASLYHGAGGLTIRDRTLLVLKNDVGLSVPGMNQMTVTANQNHPNVPSCMSPPLAVVAGDTFKLQTLVNTATTGVVETSPSTFLSLEEVPANIKAALAYTAGSGNASRAGSGAFSDLNMVTEVYDDDNMWAAGSPAIFTVPAGCNRARFHGCLQQGASINPNTYLRALANLSGAGFAEVAGSGRAGQNVGRTTGIGFFTGWISVVPGDTFKMQVSLGNLNWSSTQIVYAWAALECMPNP